MENTFEYIDNTLNYIVPFVQENKMLFTVLLSLLIVNLLIKLFTINDSEIKNYTLNEKLYFQYFRDYIESFDNSSLRYKELQSILLPKKGDYVEINYGRWKGYVGRITSVFYDTKTLYNINVSIKDNVNYGSDIPHHLLRDKERSFFSVLTDYDISNYNLLQENEVMDRYVASAY